jgi:sulfur-oxidizing protein SoxY
VTIEAPGRADDAALVPLTVRIPADAAERVKKLTLIVDKNPAPVVAEFAFGPAAGNGERVLSTRVRVDMYSNVRAVAETEDGSLYMATKFVKAAGGCSAPALKDTDAALADAGRMIVRTLGAADASSGLRQAQLMIKHPQYSGLQLNQATGFYIPARFVREIDVKRGDEFVFKMTGGISISEDPNFRFTYAGGGDETLEVTATDTEGKVFTGRTGPKGS